jgi:hypothetical protein
VRKFLLAALVGALGLAVAGVAPAAINQGQEMNINFSTKRPTAITGITAMFDNAGTRDATGKPKAARKIVIRFPRGWKKDTSVRPTCTQSKLQAQGPAGCPSRSKIGSGEAEAVTGLPALDPVNVTVTPFNSKSGLLLYIAPKPGEAGNPFVIASTVRRNVLTAVVPKLVQPTPYGEAILTKFTLKISAIRKGSDPLITSPPCPRGTWVTTGTWTYDGSTTTVRDTSPCRRG